jgi:hypothetical protein
MKKLMNKYKDSILSENEINTLLGSNEDIEIHDNVEEDEFSDDDFLNKIKIPKEPFKTMSQNEIDESLSFISSAKPFSLENPIHNLKEELALHKETLKTSHYDFKYKLTKLDIEKGEIKLDPYFISKQWDLGSKDPSGVIFHCLKTIARWGTKNSVDREIQALKAQIQRLEELHSNVF